MVYSIEYRCACTKIVNQHAMCTVDCGHGTTTKVLSCLGYTSIMWRSASAGGAQWTHLAGLEVYTAM